MNILILGIGNILFQDEGIGAHFVHYLDEKYTFKSKKSKVTIIDGGTLAQRLIPEIVKYDEIVVIDCIDVNDANPGDVYFFDYHAMPSCVNWQGSAHEVEMLQTLKMIDMNKDLPFTKILGVIPKRVADDTTFELSEEIKSSIITMENSIKNHLEQFDVEMCVKKRDTYITNIAEISYKRDIVNGPYL